MPKGKDKSVGVTGKELKKLLALCKKREVAFAYCPGGDIKDDVWTMHRKRGGEVIAREARAASEGTKVAFGTAKLSGKLLSLTCEREIANMSKRLKKWLKAEKCPLNVKVLDKDGKVLEEDIEDLPDSDFLAEAEAELEGEEADGGSGGDTDSNEGTDENAGDGDAERLKSLKARAAEVQTGMKAAPEAVEPKLAAGFKTAVEAMQGGDLDKADTTLTNLEQALAKLGAAGAAAAPPPPPPVEDPAIARLRTAASSLGKRIDGLADGAGKDKVQSVHDTLVQLIDGGDVQKATATAKALGEAITKLSAAQTQAAKPADGDDGAQESVDGAEAPLVDPNASEDGQAWNAARASLEPAVLGQLERGYGDVSKMRAAWAFFMEKGNSGGFTEGLEVVPGLEKLLQLADAAEQSA
ncbi:MAG: hypothetical protein AB3N17_00640, partial [Tateyamaria sp.]